MFSATPLSSNFRRSFAGLFLPQSHGEAKSEYKRQDSAQGEDEVQTPEPSWVAVLIKVFAQGGYEAGDADGGGDGLTGHQQGHPRDQGGGHRPSILGPGWRKRGTSIDKETPSHPAKEAH